MYYDNLDDNKEEWQKDLNSWKKRRKSVSSLRHRLDEDDADDEAPSMKAEEGNVFVNNNKSLKNRRWNKFRSFEDDDYFDDADDQTQTQHDLAKRQPLKTSSSSSSSSSSPALPSVSFSSPSWRPKERVSMVTHDVDAGARENGSSRVSDDPILREEDDGGERSIVQEKTIKINQRPNNPRGFGFEVEGGRENQLPITVGRVARGSSADVCGLKAGDTLLYLNGVDVSKHYRDSVNSVIEESINKGSVELKIQRIRHGSDEAMSDEEEEEDIGMAMNPPMARWSGSQSSHRSTPPLPPQPDYNNDCFSESPQPLPVEPPPPVNWSTFPEGRKKSDSSEGTPTGTDNSRFQKWTTNDVSVSEHQEKRAEVDHPSPGQYSASSSSETIQCPSDHTKENTTARKLAFLGIEPSHSEELKLLKEKNGLNETSTFSIRSDGGEKSSNNPHKYVAEFSASEQDSSLQRRNFHEEESNLSRIKMARRDGFAATNRHLESDQQLRADTTKQNESTFAKETKEGSVIPARNFDEDPKRSIPKNEFRTRMSKNEGIEKVEMYRNAAAEWKRRDREIKQKEEKEKRDMQERCDKFNVENDRFSTSDAKKELNQGVNKFFSRESTKDIYSQFAGNQVNDAQPSFKSRSNDILFSSSNLSTSGQFGLKKSEYKPIKLRLNRLDSSTNSPTFTSKSVDAPIEDIISENHVAKDTKGKKDEGWPVEKSEFHKPLPFTKLTNNLSKSRSGSDSKPSTTSQNQNIPSRVEDYQTRSTEEGLTKSYLLRDSLREEELELQKVKELQEIEKMKLERIREEKKVEELRLMRLKEEEEVQKMKEQRLREENEMKKLEKERQSKFDCEEKILLEEPKMVKIKETNSNFTKHSSEAPKLHEGTIKVEAGLGVSDGNPYSRLARSILSEAGLSHDKTSVKTILLEKPKFFGNDDKKYISGEQAFANPESSRYKSENVNFNPPVERRTSNYNDYANPPSRSPAYFGPTFKRLNGSHSSGKTVYHNRTPSGSETNSSYKSQHDSNINYLLYGEDTPKESHLSSGYQENSKDKECDGGIQNIKLSVGKISRNSYGKANNVLKPWQSGESEKGRTADSKPLHHEGRSTIAQRYSESDFRERSKSSGKNYNNERQMSTPPSIHQMSDNIRPTTSTYAGFAQPPHHHSRSSSSDHNPKFRQPPKEATKATDILFPASNSFGDSPKDAVTFRVSASSGNRNGTDEEIQGTRYTSSAAVDSLFAYNSSREFGQNPLRSNPISTSSLTKIFSASTTNLSLGTLEDNSIKPQSRWAVHGPSPGRSNDDASVRRPSVGGNWPNYNRTPSQFIPAPRNY